jgi:hypothetical protein
VETTAGKTAWYREDGTEERPLVEQAKEQAGQLAQQTRQTASRVADQAVQTVKTQIATQKERATEGLQEVAQVLRETGESLRTKNQGAIGQYAETGAEMVEHLSSYFRDRSLDQITGDVEEFARRQATLFLGGAFALGFMLSRFFKSSSPYGTASVQAGGNGRARTTGYDRTSTATPRTAGYGANDMASGGMTTPSTSSTMSDTEPRAATAAPSKSSGSAADRAATPATTWSDAETAPSSVATDEDVE